MLKAAHCIYHVWQTEGCTAAVHLQSVYYILKASHCFHTLYYAAQGCPSEEHWKHACSRVVPPEASSSVYLKRQLSLQDWTKVLAWARSMEAIDMVHLSLAICEMNCCKYCCRSLGVATALNLHQ